MSFSCGGKRNPYICQKNDNITMLLQPFNIPIDPCKLPAYKEQLLDQVHSSVEVLSIS